MSNLDAGVIRLALGEAITTRLAELEIFAEIESTNSYLMRQPGPAPGQMRVAATDNQTAGRGRHGRTWHSPRGSGLCLSMAYTFALSPANLPALTLAIGLGVIEALKGLGVAGVQLKWPNDLIAMDGKLGGILTEAHAQPGGAVTIVTGIGLNIDASERLDFGLEGEWALPVVDLKSQADELPSPDQLAASLISALCKTFVDYEASGFALFMGGWSEHDWLYGCEITIDTPQRRITGVGAGVADDGALLLSTRSDGMQRVTSGSVIMAGIRKKVS